MKHLTYWDRAIVAHDFLNPDIADNYRQAPVVMMKSDTDAYQQILGNMVERSERAKDPQRRYVHSMQSRLAFRGIDFLEALELVQS